MPHPRRGGELRSALDQLHEPRILAEGVEGGIDLEPARSEVVRNLEQRLELDEGLLRLAKEDEDTSQLMLHVGTVIGVGRDGKQRDTSLALTNSIRLSAEVCERGAQQDVQLPVVGRGAQLILESDPGRVGIEPCASAITAKVVGAC